MSLQQLKTLSEIKYRKSQQDLAKLQVRETVLRQELSRLRALVLETQSQPLEHAQIRAIGADVIWLRWVGQAQSKLNIELAQVLAQKEAYQAQHRRAHGKKIATEALADDADDARRKDKSARQLQTAIDQALMR